MGLYPSSRNLEWSASNVGIFICSTDSILVSLGCFEFLGFIGHDRSSYIDDAVGLTISLC
jgi:hypothetical protein